MLQDETPPLSAAQPCVVSAASKDCENAARRLAERIGLEYVPQPPDEQVRLSVAQGGLALACGNLTLQPNLQGMLARLKPGRLQAELLVKACKLKGLANPPVAVDATAGLGNDSLLLAAAGYQVHLYEKHPVIFALLESAVSQACESEDELLRSAAMRMHLHNEDSVAALANLEEPAHVVVLDPMFPARTKSAAVKKKFQLLHLLEQPCANEDELLEAAFAAHPRKVVVKRPPKGPHLAHRKPAYALSGKAVRYDCYLP